jgi:hypothetical protein
VRSVYNEQVAVTGELGDARHADHSRHAERAQQDGGMRRFNTRLEDARERPSGEKLQHLRG